MEKCRKIMEKLVTDARLERLRDLAAQAVRKVFAVNAESLVWGDGNADIREECQEIRAILSEVMCDIPEEDGVLYKEIIKPLHFLEIRKAR